MIRLSKKEAGVLQTLLDAAQAAAEACDDAAHEYNDAVATAGAVLLKAVSVFNDARDALVLEIESHVDEWQEEIENKSESWQRSEAGEAARESIDQWQEWRKELWPVEFELPDDLDLDLPDCWDMPDLGDVPA
jgi:hypothetical protein